MTLIATLAFGVMAILFLLMSLAFIRNERRAEEELQLASRVFENTIEGILITDKDAVIQRVNPAFTAITGYTPEEALGKKPNLLRSNRHSDDFYKSMWAALLSEGKWQGEIWNRKKTGEAYPQSLSITAIKNSKGETVQYVSVFYDITDLKKSQEKIEYQANHDALTELPNKQLFMDRLDMALSNAHRHKKKLAVLVLDLDNFKKINESLGHATGDLLLQSTAARLTDSLRDDDTIARVGGDEFLIILPELDYELNEAAVAEKLIGLISKPFNMQGKELFVGASVGIAIYPNDGEDPETLLKHADTAMSRAKERGKNQYRLFTTSMNQRAVRRLELEGNLRKALESNEIFPYYQPKIDLGTGRIAGMEALARWRRPDGEIISPAEFIPLGEETGLIVDIDQTIMNAACKFTKKLCDEGYKDLALTVNLSAKQFESKNLLDIIKNSLRSAGLGPECFGVEVTESSLIHDVDYAISVLHKLRDAGVKVSIDDFGTGYSSLSYIKRLPIDILKLDIAFVRDLPHDTNSKAIAKAIASMAHSMNIKMVAEGVEEQNQLDFLKSIGCDEIQGYIFSPPVEEKEFEKLLAESKSLAGYVR